ncbi:MAG: hypothetical protein LBE11_01935 [Prevotellaceae bacterium]|jgi:hypothetical protein|nr:hypothetical protein [Prevotellaceae bacterium]
MKITFFKIPKHRVFNYKPRYYDADKEELNERIRKIEENEKQTDGEYVFKRENINFRKAYAADQKRAEAKLPNKRLFVYAAILLFIIAVFVSVRNFSYLINPENYVKEPQIGNSDSTGKYDWDPETQIIIVDDDAEITENTSEQ